MKYKKHLKEKYNFKCKECTKDICHERHTSCVCIQNSKVAFCGGCVKKILGIDVASNLMKMFNED